MAWFWLKEIAGEKSKRGFKAWNGIGPQSC